MLIEDYEVDVFTPACDPGTVNFAAFARFATDIRQVLPYLNATLEGAVYLPGAPALTWKNAGHHIVFHPDRIGVSNVEDRAVAEQEAAKLVRLVNRTWEHREELVPKHETERRPGMMEVFKRLPRSNCGVCGEVSCYVFANKVAAGQVDLATCPELMP
jgi:ArsR family metal-binding transcriptional regulator